MALDLGIQENPKQLYDLGYLTSDDVEERALTFWGAFVSDKYDHAGPYDRKSR